MLGEEGQRPLLRRIGIRLAEAGSRVAAAATSAITPASVSFIR